MNLAKRVLITGVALIVLSAVLTVVLPVIGYAAWNPSSPPNQDILVVMELVIRIIANIVPALGASFVAAGTVMIYIERSWRSPTAP